MYSSTDANNTFREDHPAELDGTRDTGIDLESLSLITDDEENLERLSFNVCLDAIHTYSQILLTISTHNSILLTYYSQNYSYWRTLCTILYLFCG